MIIGIIASLYLGLGFGIGVWGLWLQYHCKHSFYYRKLTASDLGAVIVITFIGLPMVIYALLNKRFRARIAYKPDYLRYGSRK
jgi:hypothetical protein